MSAPDRPERDHRLLTHLLREVGRARNAVTAHRATANGPADAREYRSLCGDLAAAMRLYAEAAAASGVPLAYRYRDQMRLYSAVAREP